MLQKTLDFENGTKTEPQRETLIVLSCGNPNTRQERSQAVDTFIVNNIGRIDKIIISGGLGENDSENRSHAYFLQEDLSPQTMTALALQEIEIVLEEQSRNTSESLEIINSNEKGELILGEKEYILMSSASHLRRLKNDLGRHKSIEMLSCESVLKEVGALDISLRARKRRGISWTLEILRPFLNKLPKGVKDGGKKIWRAS